MEKENTSKPLDLRFSGGIGKDGRMYEVMNYNMLAENIQDYSILLRNAPQEKLYTKRTMTPESLVDVSKDGNAEMMLPDIVGSVIERPVNVEAKGSVEFALFVDKEEDETIQDAVGEVNIVLKRDGEEVSRASLP
jgi:hypothetical protein